ncbi:unnamed protein product, partial [Prorocentrum cordatum]
AFALLSRCQLGQDAAPLGAAAPDETEEAPERGGRDGRPRVPLFGFPQAEARPSETTAVGDAGCAAVEIRSMRRPGLPSFDDFSCEWSPRQDSSPDLPGGRLLTPRPPDGIVLNHDEIHSFRDSQQTRPAPRVVSDRYRKMLSDREDEDVLIVPDPLVQLPEDHRRHRRPGRTAPPNSARHGGGEEDTTPEDSDSSALRGNRSPSTGPSAAEEAATPSGASTASFGTRGSVMSVVSFGDPSGHVLSARRRDSKCSIDSLDSALASARSAEHGARDTTFEINLTKDGGATPGLNLTRSFVDNAELLITAVKEGGLVSEWNSKRPSMSVNIGDYIIKCNGKRTYKEIMNELRCANEISMTIMTSQAKGASPQNLADLHLMEPGPDQQTSVDSTLPGEAEAAPQCQGWPTSPREREPAFAKAGRPKRPQVPQLDLGRRLREPQPQAAPAPRPRAGDGGRRLPEDQESAASSSSLVEGPEVEITSTMDSTRRSLKAAARPAGAAASEDSTSCGSGGFPGEAPPRRKPLHRGLQVTRHGHFTIVPMTLEEETSWQQCVPLCSHRG